ncbi:NAD(P)-binding protein [Auricularia subglabra TFB-10046 SS5]|nr:NAD(P)-binding protein [Auricularia subglabra TFB-10046 SS5]
MPALSPPARVLVTGASGFIGAHVAREYLRRGYSVLGSVRDASKGEYLSKMFNEDFPGKFSYVVVQDIEAFGAFDVAVRNVDAVAHVASPCYHPTGHVDPDDLIGPAVTGTTNLLKSASHFGTNIMRIVITSSNATMLEPHDGHYEYTNKDWCMHAVSQVNAKGRGASGVDKYIASKVLAERGALKWMDENKYNVRFDITHILPSWVYGPPIHDVKSPEQLNVSVRRIYDCFVKGLPEEQLKEASGWFVDVRDVARAHADAHEREDLGSKRLVVSRPENPAWQDIYDAYWSAAATRRPRLPFEAPRGVPGIVPDEVRKNFATHATDEDTYGWKFRNLSTTIVDTLEGISAKGLFKNL